MDRTIKVKIGGISKEVLPTNHLMNELNEYIKEKAGSFHKLLEDPELIVDVSVHVGIMHRVLKSVDTGLSEEDLYQAYCESSLDDIMTITQEVLKKVFPFYFAQPKKKTNTSRGSRKRK